MLFPPAHTLTCFISKTLLWGGCCYYRWGNWGLESLNPLPCVIWPKGKHSFKAIVHRVCLFFYLFYWGRFYNQIHRSQESIQFSEFWHSYTPVYLPPQISHRIFPLFQKVLSCPLFSDFLPTPSLIQPFFWFLPPQISVAHPRWNIGCISYINGIVRCALAIWPLSLRGFVHALSMLRVVCVPSVAR